MANPDQQDYPAMASQLQPSHAVDVLNDRVRQIGGLNTNIAAWLAERRRLEEQYAAGLRRLARKNIDDADLGIFSVPWSAITSSADTLADSHTALAAKIEADVERPLREFNTSNREMQAMNTVQGNIASMARDVDKARVKSDKLTGKDSSKVDSANQELSNAMEAWQNQAPFVFADLQSLDIARLNQLRDCLTQFQTHELDQLEKIRQSAEHSLNVLLQVETADEIKTFALKALAMQPIYERNRRNSSVSNLATPSRPVTGVDRLTPITSQNDDASITAPSDKRKSRLGGLKRLGTVVGGRSSGKKRESKLPSTAEAPEVKEKKSGFRFGRSKDTSAAAIPEAPLEEDEAPTQTLPTQRPHSPLRTGSEILEPPSETHAQSSERSVPQQVNGTAFAILNGHQGDLAGLETPAATQAPAEQQKQVPVLPSPPVLDPITQAERNAAESSAPALNVNIRNEPIRDENADVALSSMAGKLQAPPARASTIRGRRQAASAYIPPEQGAQFRESLVPPPTTVPPPSIPEETRTSPAAQSPPSFAAAASPPLSPPVPQQSLSGNLAPNASGIAGLPIAASGIPLALRPESRSAEHGGDTGSIRSGRSLGSTQSQAIRHPDMHESGLNSSVVETVSATFDKGQVTSGTLIGEIALSYNLTDFSSPSGSETIRLKNFASLDKVAPNPAFINQVSGKEGEYAVNLASIAKTQVAFKYQARVSDANSIAPLLIHPAYKIEANQASVIVSYSLNPAFDVQGRTDVALSNVMIALTLEGANASGCQSRPVGTFSRERNLIYWQLGDIVLKAGAFPEKLLARFSTDADAKSGSVEAKWEITGSQMLGFGSGLTVQHQPPAGNDSSDPFADEDAVNGAGSWRNTAGAKKLTSGNYTAR